jgi:transcription-repair coupling factor (superfamily II helicase)
VLSRGGVAAAAQPFLAALLHRVFARRPLVIVTASLKAQEVFQQDLTTWMAAEAEGRGPKAGVRNPKSEIRNPKSGVRPSTFDVRPSTFHPSPPPSALQTPEPISAPAQPLFYPGWEILPHEDRLPHADVISERLETLVALCRPGLPGTSGVPVVVTNVIALLQRTFAPEALAGGTRALARGDRCDPLDLVEWLEEQGYEPEAQVTQKGEIALRGGILDVYPLTSPWPVRLEFFGDELESLRDFDPLTQISRQEVAAITLPPAGELGILRRVRSAECGVRNAQSGGRRAEGGTRDGSLGTLPDHLSADPNLNPNPNLRPAGGSLGTLLDYLPAETILLLCEPEQLDEQAQEYGRQVPQGDPFFVSWQEFQRQAEAKGMTVLEVAEEEVRGKSEIRNPKSEVGDLSGEGPVAQGGPHFLGLDAYRPLLERAPEPRVAEEQRREFFAQLHRWLRQGYAVQVFCNNDGERQRFAEIWKEYGLENPKSEGQGPKAEGRRQKAEGQSPNAECHSPGSEGLARPWTVDLPSPALRQAGCGLRTALGALSSGFLYEEARLVVVTDAEVFGRYKVQRPRRLKSAHAQATRSALDIDFAELEEGDYVVHLQHGIGRYLGLQVLPLGAGAKPTEGTAASANAGQECLVIEYASGNPAQGPPKLYVPVTEAHLVSKYVGAGKARPPLNTLGGTRWLKTRLQAERAVRDVASELLAIQAARDCQPGHAFLPDTSWQREFESAFVFEETPDQMRAIVETKADMERAKPMDRLICGDVGFGKTEVAIRAAFKAILDGKQVAMLVPTTVLAQQHFNTFRERMADYPVRLELLSRFRGRRAQQEVVRDLAAGAVDIVIGTHRLLQPDVAFKDLGLVVIDEEQRFGVMHKEKFKMLRKLVDVLTLSATPIPRTLYLALSGARDMSTIQTPPHDRLPVETLVMQYDERLIRDAIQRELNRGGQVFFLHNRVMTIQTMAQRLQTLLPQARIVVGHGQMDSNELEEVMTRFVNGAADVLLSTTIIESGLDIPNANTIIIDRADRFGLSDLYQLRGRVGRYKHQAYAYLLLPRHARLLTDVRKRMSALKQYSTLGSGFKIAMRDLEIRGAGNLLGAEQSGHITAVGFELYCQLLKQSIASVKGEKVKPRIQVQVHLDFLALSPGDERIPFKYISDARQRIEIYRKLAQATEPAAVAEVEKEARDRFGPPPLPLQRLLQVARLKVLAAERGVSAIEVKDDKLMLTRNNDYVMAGSRFPRLAGTGATARLTEIEQFLLAL